MKKIRSMLGTASLLCLSAAVLALPEQIALDAQLGDICLGVLYWEPAWIPVRSLSGLSGAEYDQAYAQCQEAWLTNGAGWANQCSADYDLSVGDTYGGSQWECLALFDFDGHALDSLNAFNEAVTD